MICDICKKNPAVIHIEKHAVNNHTQMKICCECAGIENLSPDKLKSEDIQKIISDLAAMHEPSEISVCEDCGTSSSEIEKSRKVGCGSCYTHLRTAINLPSWQSAKNLKHIGRTPYHVFVKPNDFAENVEDLQTLEEKLTKSIAVENYEDAAELRDRIEELKKALS